ncbi:MAG: hypothetical protein Q4F65_00990 [Propionibacteriaceae bacterium]|nr:hypothetical protein [Propionibacteriaceae bacterium]
MKPARVLIESPFAGDWPQNLAYARRAVADSLSRGEAPFASHLLYTQPGILDDNDPAEREQGIQAGLEWGHAAALTAVYVDLGVSPGMRDGIARAEAQGRPVEYRVIGPNPTPEVENTDAAPTTGAACDVSELPPCPHADCEHDCGHYHGNGTDRPTTEARACDCVVAGSNDHGARYGWSECYRPATFADRYPRTAAAIREQHARRERQATTAHRHYLTCRCGYVTFGPRP